MPGLMVSMAVGDAYGGGFEYAPSATVTRYNDLSGYQKHHKHALTPGCYTDDTQMSVAIAQLLLDKAPAEWTVLDVARTFVGVFYDDPRQGYAGAFYTLLDDITKRVRATTLTEPERLNLAAVKFLSTIRPHSIKSGGAMRAPVLGVLKDPHEVVDRAMMQASLTHATYQGMHAAAAAALMTHYFYHRVGPKKDLGAFIEFMLGGTWAMPWTRAVGSPGQQHVRAAITAVVTHDNMADLLRACVAFTGDVDTVAAIALAAASQSDEVDQNLPPVLLAGLERGSFGYPLLEQLDRALEAKYPRPKSKRVPKKVSPPAASAPEAPTPLPGEKAMDALDLLFGEEGKE